MWRLVSKLGISYVILIRSRLSRSRMRTFRITPLLSFTAWRTKYSPNYHLFPSRLAPFKHDGERSIWCVGIEDGIKTVGKVRVTDLECTIIENIKNFSRVDNLEYCCIAFPFHDNQCGRK